MKKLTVALSAVAASVFLAMSANAAEIYNKDGNKVDLYGKVVGQHKFSTDDGHTGNNSYDDSYVRLGFKGETQINDQLTGFGQWEYHFSGSNAEWQGTRGNKTRLAFAGLKFGDFGTIDYGRNYGVVYDALSYTDVSPEFGPDTVQNDNFFAGRNNGFLTYRNTDFFGLVEGLDFAIQYLGKNERGEYTGGETANGDGVGGSISYEYEGFSIVAAYAAADRTNAQTDRKYTTTDVNGNVTVTRNPFALGDGGKAEQWATSVKYDANNLYLAATYGETRNTLPISYSYSAPVTYTYTSPWGGPSYTYTSVNNYNFNGIANKTEDFAVVAQYQFDFGLRPSLAYFQSKAKDLSNNTSAAGFPVKHDDGFVSKFVEVGATYYFNKNMSTYVDYKINLLDKNQFTERTGLSTDDQVAVGLIYQF